jgi:hypothetical protein
MTPEKHDPWALLRDAREYVGFCPFDPDLMNVVGKIRARIDAALVAHKRDAVAMWPTEDVVRWQATRADSGLAYGWSEQQDNLTLTVHQVSAFTVLWAVERYGTCSSIDEAKQAAIAAARGMKS